MNYQDLAKQADDHIQERKEAETQRVLKEISDHAPYHVVDQLPVDEDLIKSGVTFGEINRRRYEHADKITEILSEL